MIKGPPWSEMHSGRAATRLFMTQPALSTSVMRLEDELQVRLFERDSKTMSDHAHRPGHAHTRKGNRVACGQARAVRTRHGCGPRGLIEVGFTASLLFRGFDVILKRFKEAFPAVELSVREISSQVQLELLRAGRLDAAFNNSPVPPPGYPASCFSRNVSSHVFRTGIPSPHADSWTCASCATRSS
jgi:DNA-binding transcriptional LysR family regulator